MSNLKKIFIGLFSICFLVATTLAITTVFNDIVEADELPAVTVVDKEMSVDTSKDNPDWIQGSTSLFGGSAMAGNVEDYKYVKVTLTGVENSQNWTKMTIYLMDSTNKYAVVYTTSDFNFALTDGATSELFFDVVKGEGTAAKADHLQLIPNTVTKDSGTVKVNVKVEFVNEKILNPVTIINKEFSVDGANIAWQYSTFENAMAGNVEDYKYVKVTLTGVDNSEIWTKMTIYLEDSKNGYSDVYTTSDFNFALTDGATSELFFDVVKGAGTAVKVDYLKLIPNTITAQEVTKVNVKIEFVNEKILNPVTVVNKEISVDTSNVQWPAGTFASMGGSAMGGNVEDYKYVKVTLTGVENSQNWTKMTINLKDSTNKYAVVYTTSDFNFALTDGKSKEFFFDVVKGEGTNVKADYLQLIPNTVVKDTGTVKVNVKVEFANEKIETPLETETIYKKVAEVESNQTSWIFYEYQKDITVNEISKYSKIRLVLAATKADMVRKVLLQFGPDTECLSIEKALTLTAGKNVIDLELKDFTNKNVADVTTFKPAKLTILLKTNTNYADGVKTKLTAGVQFVNAVDNTKDFETYEEDAQPTQDVETVTVVKQVAEVESNQSSWIFFVHQKDITVDELSKYSKIRLVLAATKADMVRKVLLQFGTDSEGLSIQKDLTLSVGKNVIDLELKDFTNAGSVDTATFKPAKLTILLKTNTTYANGVKTKLTAGVQFVNAVDNTTDFATYEEDGVDVETVTLYKKVGDITANVSDWKSFTNETLDNTKKLGDYKSVELIFAATKAGMIREVLLQLGPSTGCLYYNNYNLSFVEGLNTISIPLSSFTSETVTDVNEFVPTSVSLLLHTDKNTTLFKDTDTTKLTFGIKLVGDVDNTTEFKTIEYDPEAPVETITIFKDTKEVTANVSSWNFFVYQKDLTVKKLGTYTKVRLIIAASKADMIREVMLQFGPDDNYVKYQNWSLNLIKGKNVIEVNVSDLTSGTTGTIADFVPTKLTILLHTDKADTGYTASTKTKLTVGVQLVTDIDNTKDFETYEEDPVEITEITAQDNSVTLEVSSGKAVRPQDNPTKRGFIFAGYYSDSTFQTEFDFDATITVDTKLYVKWDDNPNANPDPTEGHTFFDVENTITGNSNSWIGLAAKTDISVSESAIGKYTGVRITIAGTNASWVSQYYLKIGGGDNYLYYNDWYNFSCKDGTNVFELSINDLKTYGTVDIAALFPEDGQLMVKTEHTTETTESTLSAKVEFIVFDPEVKTDIKLFNFDMKGGEVVYDEEKGTYTEDRMASIAVFGTNDGKDGDKACTITVVSDEANSQVWLTTGGTWRSHNPVDVKNAHVIYFQNYKSFDLYFYVEDHNYIENLMFTFTDNDGTSTGRGLQRILGGVENDGWQHVRMNLDSMNTINEFDWDVKTEFVCVEIVVTIRVGTPVGTKLIFDDFYFNTESCNPTIIKNQEFSLEGTTGTEIDLSSSVTSTHPFGDRINTSYGVKFARTASDEKEAVAISGSKFTPSKAGIYYITAIVTDSLGASAQTSFEITVTGNDIDTEAPTVKFGTIPSYVSSETEIDLSLITVKDDVDTNPTVVIKVYDDNNAEITVTGNKFTISKAGRYTIKVTATDAAGHSKEVQKVIASEIETGGTNTDDKPAEKKTGCGSSMTLGGIMLLAGAALVAIKRRK